MIAMSSTKYYIFVCCKFTISVKLTFLKIYISILWCVGILKWSLLIFDFRPKVFILHLLNLIEQIFVRRFIIAFRQHHCPSSSRIQQFESLCKSDLLRYPLDRCRRINHIKLLTSKIICDEIIVYDVKIGKFVHACVSSPHTGVLQAQ